MTAVLSSVTIEAKGREHKFPYLTSVESFVVSLLPGPPRRQRTSRYDVGGGNLTTGASRVREERRHRNPVQGSRSVTRVPGNKRTGTRGLVVGVGPRVSSVWWNQSLGSVRVSFVVPQDLSLLVLSSLDPGQETNPVVDDTLVPVLEMGETRSQSRKHFRVISNIVTVSGTWGGDLPSRPRPRDLSRRDCRGTGDPQDFPLNEV